MCFYARVGDTFQHPSVLCMCVNVCVLCILISNSNAEVKSSSSSSPAATIQYILVYSEKCSSARNITHMWNSREQVCEKTDFYFAVGIFLDPLALEALQGISNWPISSGFRIRHQALAEVRRIKIQHKLTRKNNANVSVTNANRKTLKSKPIILREKEMHVKLDN